MLATHLYFALISSVALGEFITLQSPRITNWGDWYGWAECSNNTYAAGVKVKVEPQQNKGDDTGLNAVTLYCKEYNWGSYEAQRTITSGEGPWGEWQATKWCPRGQVLIGFKLRSESTRKNGDDVAAVNFGGICGSPFQSTPAKTEITGDTPEWGDWTTPQFCPEGHAVCGIQTQIEEKQGKKDDTSLNNVNLKCCPVAFSCTPDVKLVTLDTFDNRQGASDMQFEYTVRTSFTFTNSQESGLTKSERNIVSRRISSELGAEGGGLSAKVSSELSISNERETIRSLQNMVQETVEKTYEKKIALSIPKGKQTMLKQLYFTCGEYRVGLAKTINTSF